jgi:hypothetical protein
MTLLLCITLVVLVARLERRVGIELDQLDADRRTAPHGFIDFNLHNT